MFAVRFRVCRRVFAIKRIPPAKGLVKTPADKPDKRSLGRAMTRSARDAVIRELRPRLADLARSMGDTLVDTVFVNEPHGTVLRVTIDKADPSGADPAFGQSRLSLSDCEAFHRALLPLVESVDYDTLEVESPGADRPIVTAADWARAVNHDIEINLYKAERGAKRWHGRLVSVSDDSVAIETSDGEHVFGRRSIAIARPWISMDTLDIPDDPAISSEIYTQDNDLDEGE